jgi:bacteriocin-like protein
MKNLPKKLSKEEMKKISGGVNKTLWDCYENGRYIGGSCSSGDPSSLCPGLTCTNTGVSCTLPFGCP